MAFSGSGAFGVIETHPASPYRLAIDLRTIQRKRGYLSYDAIIAEGWSSDEVAEHLEPAIRILRNLCWSHWPTCPSTIVVDAKLSLLLTEHRQ